jgi:hypothetical protein
MCLEEFKKTKDPQSGELILDRQSWIASLMQYHCASEENQKKAALQVSA